jgi:hypothetical protein
MNCSLAILLPTVMDKHNIKIYILPFWLVRKADDYLATFIWLVRKADDYLATFICRLSRNSGNLNLLDP